MHGSTDTLDLDPAVNWRRVGMPKTIVPRAAPPANVRPGDLETEPAIGAPHPDPGRKRPDLGHALEFACFVATLAAIGVLELGFFAFLA